MNIEKRKCPGCGRHCPLSAPKCKFGRHYLEKKQEEMLSSTDQGKKKKWELHVTSGGTLWQLLSTSCAVKKMLCKKKCTEQQLLAAFTVEEVTILSELLKKFSMNSGCIP